MQVLNTPITIAEAQKHSVPVKAVHESLSSHNPPPFKAAAYLELLLMRFDVLLVALRTDQILHIFGSDEQLNPEPGYNLNPAYLGHLKGYHIPIFDTARLLGLSSACSGINQILLVQIGTEYAGLAVSNTIEVAKASFSELFPLPALVEQNRCKPVAWALWVRPGSGIVTLLEPSELLALE